MGLKYKINNFIVGFLLIAFAAAPLQTMAQTSGANEVGLAVYKASRSADAIGVPVGSEAGAQAAGATASTKQQSIYNWLEGFVRTTLKKTVLDRLVDQIISYIQGNGKPQFVTDWQGFLQEAGDAALGSFATEVTGVDLCSPFSLQLQLSLFAPVKKFSERSQCTLTNIVSNIENFTNDFRDGGWIAFAEASQPQNHFFGAMIAAVGELESRKSAAKGAAYSDAQASGGYVSAKDKKGKITTPGALSRDLVSKAITSDIDFLLSAEQLQEYAAAITDALVNRLLKEGLSKVSDSGSSVSRSAQIYNDLITNNFNAIKGSVLGQLDLTIGPRQDANPIMQSTISALQQFIVNLNSLYSSFDSLTVSTCPPPPGQFFPINVSQYKQLIQDEISAASSTIPNIQDDINENNIVIAQLIDARLRTEPIQNTNEGYVQLLSIQAEVAGIAFPTEADQFKAAAQAQQSSVSQNINQKLSQFNQQLNLCQGGTGS